ncbi:hypothetical protein DFJ77DRAFT_459816 [Powellomyces hirtus]|nr:hypothetical protein DFJ77DRAFT_459816 [Powellomyces hirtus]
MHFPRSFLVCLALVLAVISPCFIGAAAATQDAERQRIDSKTGLIFTHEFPANPFNMITAGEATEIKLHIDNQGELKQTVFAVSGFLSQPNNHTMPKRNLTARSYKTAVGPSDKVTVTYKFELESEPGEHGLVIYVDVTDEEGKSRRTVGYKGLVKVVENDSMFDLQSISIYLMTLALLGGIAYMSYDSFMGGNKKKAGSRTKRAAAAAAPVVESTAEPGKPDMDWIPQHLVDAQNGVRRQSSRIKKRQGSTSSSK